LFWPATYLSIADSRARCKSFSLAIGVVSVWLEET
jgi:hypothetical protein